MKVNIISTKSLFMQVNYNAKSSYSARSLFCQCGLIVHYSLVLFMISVITCIVPNVSYANNASYIALSSQIARKHQLEVVANNAANINTTGFEQDAIIFRAVNLKQNHHRNNSFVWTETTYRNGEHGPVKITNRPTDLAILGEGYFKLVTPQGVRYTLDGSMLVNNQGILANSSGYPFLSTNNDVIEIPDDYQNIEIARDGTIFVDMEELDQIGVFGFTEKDPIIKQGGNLYAISGADFVLEEFALISGALRGSNVNSTLAMSQMVEMQRAYGLTTDLMSNVNETETSAINKLTK